MISVKLAPDLLTLTGIDLLIVIMCGIVDVCTTPCIIYNFQTLMKVLFSVHQSVRALDVNINRHKPPVDMCRYSNLCRYKHSSSDRQSSNVVAFLTLSLQQSSACFIMQTYANYAKTSANCSAN